MAVGLLTDPHAWFFGDPYEINAFGILKIQPHGLGNNTPPHDYISCISLQSVFHFNMRATQNFSNPQFNVSLCYHRHYNKVESFAVSLLLYFHLYLENISFAFDTVLFSLINDVHNQSVSYFRDFQQIKLADGQREHLSMIENKISKQIFLHRNLSLIDFLQTSIFSSYTNPWTASSMPNDHYILTL